MAVLEKLKTGLMRSGFVVLVLMLAQGAAAQRNTLVVDGSTPYLAGPYPDRIVLVITEDPAHSQTVNWRTNLEVTEAKAQITAARAGVGLHLDAQTLPAATIQAQSANGVAHHHHVTFQRLQPDTLYAYRVSGNDTWSEWFQFRTAADAGEFAFLYFGDAQNSVKSHFSRIIREANSVLPRPALMLHAGDLVNQRETGNHDDEWGEWFDAGSFLHAMNPSLPVTGNHEFVDSVDADGNERYELPAAWTAHFTLPTNGPANLQDTVYYSRYQDVLFVALDSTRALQDEAVAITQARWLDELLVGNDSRWVIISHHHPMFSVSQGRDNPPLRQHWQPVFDKYRVDLVLQGHDHTYGRDTRGTNVAEGNNMVDAGTGTVYVVSVAGPKMYMVSEEALENMDRTGEDIQLFQIVRVRHEGLVYESRTATGEIYDAFDLMKNDLGDKTLINRLPEGAPVSVCSNPDMPRPTRCWEGTELVE
jgi:acid phosphatase type 7